MKIAMIGQKGIPSRAGGVEIHVEELSKRLAGPDCRIEVYCRKGYCDEKPEFTPDTGITVKYTPYIRSKHLDAITHTFTATLRALFSNCDIFHYHALGPSTLAFIPRIFRKKVVCTVHGLDWQRVKWGKFASRYLKFGEYASAKFAHRTISVSRNLAEYYQQKYKIDTAFIPNGIQRPELLNPKIIKEKYDLDADGYILFLARLVPEKGAHYLIEAYNRLNTPKKLVIAGGTSHTDDYASSLSSMAGENNQIIFTGFVKDEELAELYSNAYFYVLPSDVEGMPISLLEAMSYGNCCLVSDIPENTDVIGSFGYTFKKADIADLASKMETLLIDKSLVSDIRQFSANYILNKYNWEQTAAQTRNIYDGLTAAKKLVLKRD